MLPRRLFPFAAACAASAALLGCPSDDGPPDPPQPSCTLEPVGDLDAPIQLELTHRGLDGAAHPLEDGAADPPALDIVTPPQGGRVLFVGVRATNIDPCAVELSGALRDLGTSQLTVDSRTVNLQPTGDGWAGSVDADIATFANVGVCPNQWSSRDVFDQDYTLEVNVAERKSGRTAKKEITVHPLCSEADPGAAAECLCICRQGYELGEPCM